MSACFRVIEEIGGLEYIEQDDTPRPVIFEESNSNVTNSVFECRRQLQRRSPLSSPVKQKKEPSFIQPCCVVADDIVSDSSDDGLPYCYSRIHLPILLSKENQQYGKTIEDLEKIESFNSTPCVSIKLISSNGVYGCILWAKF